MTGNAGRWDSDVRILAALAILILTIVLYMLAVFFATLWVASQMTP